MVAVVMVVVMVVVALGSGAWQRGSCTEHHGGQRGRVFYMRVIHVLAGRLCVF